MLDGWERELVEASPVGRLATLTPAGGPHLVPVCYVLLGNEIVIVIDEKPKRGGTLARLRNIAHDPRVSLLVDHYDDDWTALAWVRIDGRAAVVPGASERPGTLAALRAKYPQYRRMALESAPLIVVTSDRVVSWRFSEP